MLETFKYSLMLLSIARYFQALPNIVRYQPLLSSGTPCDYSLALHSFDSAISIQREDQVYLENIATHIVQYYQATRVNIVPL